MSAVSRLVARNFLSTALHRTVRFNRRILSIPHCRLLSTINNSPNINFVNNNNNNNNNNNKNDKVKWGFNYTTSSNVLDDLAHAAIQGNNSFIISKIDEVSVEELRNSILLGCAAKGGHVSTIEILLKKGVDIEAVSADGYTPLIEALKHCQNSAAKILIENGASLTAHYMANKFTPLHLAAYIESEELVKLILEKGVDINETHKGGNALACVSSSPKMTKFLLNCGADVNLKGNTGSCVIHFSVDEGALEVVKMLLEAGADIESKDEDGNTPMLIAAKNNNAKMMVLLASHGANVNAQNNFLISPLGFSANNEYFPGIQLLLKLGANVDGHPNKSPVMAAILSKNLEIVKTLVEAGASILHLSEKEDGYTPLAYSILTGANEISLYLLQHIKGEQMIQPDKDEYDIFIEYLEGDTNLSESVLHKACVEGNLEIVKRLKKSNNFDVDAMSQEGRTPLTAAVRRGKYIEMIEYLLSLGADPNKGENTGCTPLLYAADENNSQIIELLVRNGAEVDKHNELRHAVSNGKLEAAQTLINLGAKLNDISLYCNSIECFEMLVKNRVDFTKADEKDGNFPLIIFAENGNLELVKKMVEIGVDVNCSNKTGLTPILVSLSFVEIFHYLLEKGAKVDVIAQGGYTILHAACGDNQTPASILEELLFLVKDKISISMKASELTPLHVAVQLGNVEKMRILLNAGADIRQKVKNTAHENEFISAIHLAKTPEMIKVLVKEMGFDVNERGNRGSTAAHYSTNEAIGALIEMGADLNILGERGCSPLHLAVEDNNLIMTEMMLKGGANKYLKNKNGETPLDLAIELNFPEIAKILQEHEDK